MKKITLTSLASVIAALAFSVPVIAATTVSFTPAQMNVSTGQQFNVAVTVDPQGVKNYVEKIEVAYPADILEVSSFTIGSSGMALNQPGYDSVDNVNGVLLKTAGYAGGISSATPFGTITFTAKKAGSGTISIDGQSVAFQAHAQNAITSSGASFDVSAAAVSPAKPNKPNASLAPVSSINGQVLSATNTPSVAAATALANAQLAAAANASGRHIWLWVLIVLLVLMVIVWWLYRRRSGRRSLY